MPFFKKITPAVPSALLLAVLFFSPVAARGETIMYDANGIRSDASLPTNAKDMDGRPQYGLSDPDSVWGSDFWPITDKTSVGYPVASLFPWSSGSDNTVIVDGVSISHTGGSGGNTGYVIGGLWQDPRLATRNVVTVRNGASVGKIIGGAALGTASWNTVYLTSGATAEQVTGGLSVTENTGHSASYNRVFITDATSNGIVAGGWNASGTPGDEDTGAHGPGGSTPQDNDVFMNAVRVDGRSTIKHNIYGGYNEGNSKTYGNTVTIAGGAINPVLQIAGGYSSVTGTAGKTSVYGNTVTVTGGDITWSGSSAYTGIYGGRSQGGNADVNENHVVIKGGTIHSDGVVSGGAGGKSGSGMSRVFFNTVEVSGGAVAAKVAGGRIADGGTAWGNTVTLSGGEVTGDIYGAYDSSSGTSGATIRDNTVFLYGGKAVNVYGGHADTGESRGNGVVVAGAAVTGDIYGGYAKAALASGNSVSLYSGAINSDVYGGGSDTGAAEGNRVDLRGATVAGSVYGGRAATAANARNNAVNLYGGTVTESVYGNYLGADSDAGQYIDWQNNGNTLNAVSGMTSVGGVNRFAEARIFSGAQINVTGVPNASGGLTRKTVFGNLRNDGLLSFYNGIHNNAEINDDAARFAGEYSGGGAIGLEISFDKGGSPTVSDRVVFNKTPASRVMFHFKALPDSIAAGYADNRPTSEFAFMEDGGTLNFTTLEHGYGVYAYTFEQRGQSLFAALTDAHVGEIGKGYSDGSAAELAQISAISETFLRDNLENAVLSTNGGGWGIAANIGYSKQRFHAGNDIDLEGFSALVTLSYHREGTPFAVGVFGDTFQGEFEARNGFSLPTGDFSVTSKGDLESYGGGISFQYREKLDEAIAAGDFAAWTPGAYVKALARAGYSKMDFETETSSPSSFDVGGLYYGATLGGGYVFTPAPRFVMDLYGYGAWTAMEERDATDSLGQHIDFDRVDSLRFISGFRAAYKATEHVLPYAGMGMEWETLGRPGVHVDGYKTETADLSGLSGLIELGVNSKVDDNFFLDCKAIGSVGERQGIGGMLEIRYSF